MLKPAAYESAYVYYGSISLFTTILHNLFILYHIDMFVSVYKIDKTSFWIGEMVFLLWNSINDPLFGWLGDKQQLMLSGDQVTSSDKESLNISESTGDTTNGRQGASHRLIVSRIKVIKWAGPLMAVSFFNLWINWHSPLLQFILCLCAYDAFLTLIDLQHSALLAELSTSPTDRAAMNGYQSLFSAVGSVSVFISYAVWDKSDMARFRIYSTVLAVVSSVGVYAVTRHLQKTFTTGITAKPQHTPATSDGQQSRKSFLNFLKRAMKQRNFVIFIMINLIQVFHCHFNSNFFPLFLETLVDSKSGSILIGISFVLPHLNNILFLAACRKYGVYIVMKYLFCTKLAMAIIMWYVGLTHSWVLYIFIACNRIFTEGICKLMSLVISDLVDEDFVINRRSEPISALLFGMANLLGKPGQTLAPIVGTSLVSVLAGRDIFFDGKTQLNGHKLSELPDTDVYKEACFSLIICIPIFCAILQLALWSFYKLHGRYLERIQYFRINSSNQSYLYQQSYFV